MLQLGVITIGQIGICMHHISLLDVEKCLWCGLTAGTLVMYSRNSSINCAMRVFARRRLL